MATGSIGPVFFALIFGEITRNIENNHKILRFCLDIAKICGIIYSETKTTEKAERKGEKMNVLEANPRWKRNDIQKQIQEMIGDIEEWQKMTAEDQPNWTNEDAENNARLTRIAKALRTARDAD